MRRIIYAPSIYIQGENELSNLNEHTSRFGKKPFILIDKFIKENYGTNITHSFPHAIDLIDFTGECSHNTINKLVSQIDGHDVVVGIGGGKALDTAKSVAFKANIPMIICPSIASSDAPCSSLSVIYTDAGEVEEYVYHPKSPDLVLLDTTIISKAPVRMLSAGIGDAIATYYEMKLALAANKDALVSPGFKMSITAQALAEACKDVLYRDGVLAYQSAKRKVLSRQLDDVIEANTYLSCLGAVSGNVSIAHGLQDAFTLIPEAHHLLHGEKVAFGTLCLLVAEKAPIEEIKRLHDLLKAVKLPTCLADFGIVEDVEAKVWKVAEATKTDWSPVHFSNFDVTPDLIYAVIMTVDELSNVI